MTVQIGGISGRLTKSWLPFRVLYQDNADRQAGVVFANTIANGPARGAAAIPYRGSVVLPSGRVVLVPYRSATIGLFDAATGIITAGPAHGGGSVGYQGGIMLPDGRILMLPALASDFIVYDPASNEIVARVPHGQPAPPSGRNHFHGAVLAADDAVYVLHTSVRRVGRFDPVTQTFALVGDVVPNDTGASDVPFYAAVLTPDRRVIFMPRANSRPVAFDPATLSSTALAPSGITSATAFGGSFLGPEAAIYAVRGSTTGAPMRYDPATDSWTTLPGAAFITGMAFSGGVPLRSGRIAFLPKNGQYIGVWDTAAQTWTQGAAVAADAAASYHDSAVQLADGRVLVLADGAAEHKLWTPYTGGTPLPYDFIASRYIGNRG